jgi:hypothetical protein
MIPLRVIQMASLPNSMAEEISMPPNLETFIPGESLPDVIDVYIDDDFFYEIHNLLGPFEVVHCSTTYQIRTPVPSVYPY